MEELLKLLNKNEYELAKIEEKISIALGDLLTQQEVLRNKNDEIKEKIKEAMENNEIKKYENDFISITYVAPTTRITVDSTKLKENFADIYEQCQKVSNVKSSIRIKVKQLEIPEQKEVQLIEI